MIRHLNWRSGLLGITLYLVTACANTGIVPLVGEDPEIAKLLGKKLPENPRTSAMATARRLYLALTKRDARMVWAYLAERTRKTLNARAALIGVSGRELLESGSLPKPDGTLQKVRFETVFFGRALKRLKKKPEGVKTGPDQRIIFAISRSGSVTQVVFLKEDDGWKLLKTKL